MQSATGLSGRGRHRAPWKERVAGTNAAEPRNRGNENDGYAEMLLAARPLHAVSVTAFSSIPSLLPFLGFPCPYCPRSRRTTTKRAQSLDVLGLGESFDQSPLSLHTERQTDHPVRLTSITCRGATTTTKAWSLERKQRSAEQSRSRHRSTSSPSSPSLSLSCPLAHLHISQFSSPSV